MHPCGPHIFFRLHCLFPPKASAKACLKEHPLDARVYEAVTKVVERVGRAKGSQGFVDTGDCKGQKQKGED